MERTVARPDYTAPEVVAPTARGTLRWQSATGRNGTTAMWRIQIRLETHPSLARQATSNFADVPAQNSLLLYERQAMNNLRLCMSVPVRPNLFQDVR